MTTFIVFFSVFNHLSLKFSDEAFEASSISGRNVYESVRLNHTTSVLEGLQSQLKLREGITMSERLYIALLFVVNYNR